MQRLHPRMRIAGARPPERAVLVPRLSAALLRGDPVADLTVKAYASRGEALSAHLRHWFEFKTPHPDTDPVLHDLVTQVRALPSWADPERLSRGGRLFTRTGIMSGIVLGARSLVLGYASPAGNKPLIFSGRLEHRAAGRLRETARFVQSILAPNGMAFGNEGFEITLWVRLMHARIRVRLEQDPKWNHDAWAVPINQHDMLATILLFSVVVRDGLERLGFSVTAQEGEDNQHLWRLVGHVIGVEPNLLPDRCNEARALADFILRTQGPPDDDARRLTRALLDVTPDPETQTKIRARRLKHPGFGEAICRYLIGPQLADALAVGGRPWLPAVHALKRSIRLSETARAWAPSVDQTFLQWGRDYWDESAKGQNAVIPVDYRT